MSGAGAGAAQEEKPSKLVQLQFDYAWKWFSYHADQRTKMFNYMLVAMGIFATAIVSAFNNNLLYVVALLSATSATFALIFSRLDKRNEELVRLGEEILAHLERTQIFSAPPTIEDRAGNEIEFGILHRQAQIEQGKPQTWQYNARRGKHRFWLPTIAKLIAVVFFAVAALAIYLIVVDP